MCNEYIKKTQCQKIIHYEDQPVKRCLRKFSSLFTGITQNTNTLCELKQRCWEFQQVVSVVNVKFEFGSFTDVEISYY